MVEDKKHWLDVECEVCHKIFKKPFQVLHRIKNTDWKKAKMEFCSLKCQNIAIETWDNIQTKCIDCGKEVELESYDLRKMFYSNFKKRKSFPICDECAEKDAKEIREELERG